MTPMTPILLSAEQHEQVKQRLAALLEEHYSITRQSPGKLEYLAAVLMGFTNHHQRHALLNASTQEHPQMTTSLQEENQWPAGWMRTHQGEMTGQDRATLQARGWVCWQDNGEYEDYDFEVTYIEQDGDRHSFNAVLTIHHGEKYAYITLGDNLGDGINNYLEFRLGTPESLLAHTYTDAVLALLHQENTDGARRFAENFQTHSAAASDILSELLLIAAWCSPASIADMPLVLAGCSEWVRMGSLAPRAR